MTGGIDDHPYASGNCHSTNSGDEGIGLSSYCADTNCVGFASNTLIADIDVVIACGEMPPASTLNAMLKDPVVFL
jgi:hypothetical protein